MNLIFVRKKEFRSHLGNELVRQFAGPKVVEGVASGQIGATLAQVTANGGLVRQKIKFSLYGLGIIVTCLDISHDKNSCSWKSSQGSKPLIIDLDHCIHPQEESESDFIFWYAPRFVSPQVVYIILSTYTVRKWHIYSISLSWIVCSWEFTATEMIVGMMLRPT